MEPKQLKKLVKQLRAMGISYYKDQTVELELGSAPSKPTRQSTVSPTEIVESDKIPHVVQDLKSVMALSDTDLVDRLFPEPTEASEDN